MPESAELATKGSNLILMPPDLHSPWPTGLQYAARTSSGAYGSWIDAEFYNLLTVEYPGYWKFKTDSAVTLRFYNGKTADEAAAIIGETVIDGIHEEG